MSNERPLTIWIVKDGEDVPSAESPRAFRVAQLAEDLVALGCNVTWFASTFGHGARKTSLDPGRHEHPRGYQIEALAARPYNRSRSLARLLHHRDFNDGLRRAMELEPAPDLIFCCVPTPSAAAVVRSYARSHHVPYILDIRDLWPDTLISSLPNWARPLAGLLVRLAHRALSPTYRDAVALTALNPRFLSWGLGIAGRDAGPSDGSFGLSAWVPSTMPAPPSWWPADQPDEIVVSFLGTVSPQVDLGPIAEAAQQLSARPIRFIVAGYGGADVASQFVGAASTRVHCRPRLTGDELAFSLLRSDAVVAPYRPSPDFEANLSNKAVEALTLRKPLALALERGRLADIVREFGNGFIYRSSSELIAQLSALVQDRDALGAMRDGATRARVALTDELDARRQLASHVVEIAELHRKGGAARGAELPTSWNPPPHTPTRTLSIPGT